MFRVQLNQAKQEQKKKKPDADKNPVLHCIHISRQKDHHSSYGVESNTYDFSMRLLLSLNK